MLLPARTVRTRCIFVYMYICIYIYEHMRIHIRTHTHIHAHTHARTHTSIRTHTHTHTHTHTLTTLDTHLLFSLFLLPNHTGSRKVWQEIRAGCWGGIRTTTRFRTWVETFIGNGYGIDHRDWIHSERRSSFQGQVCSGWHWFWLSPEDDYYLPRFDWFPVSFKFLWTYQLSDQSGLFMCEMFSDCNSVCLFACL